MERQSVLQGAGQHGKLTKQTGSTVLGRSFIGSSERKNPTLGHVNRTQHYTRAPAHVSDRLAGALKQLNTCKVGFGSVGALQVSLV